MARDLRKSRLSDPLPSNGDQIVPVLMPYKWKLLQVLFIYLFIFHG